MMTPKKAFSYYFGLRLHFSSESYSILKYGPDTSRASDKFSKLSPGLKSKFNWMAEKFQTTQNLVYACLASELESKNCQYVSRQEILDAYFKFKGRRESMTYHLNSEFNKYDTSETHDFTNLLYAYIGGKYSPEFILLIDHTEGFLDNYLNQPEFSFVRPAVLRLIKYKDFFSPAKYSSIINHEEPIPS